MIARATRALGTRSSYPPPVQDGRKRRKPREKLPCPPSSLLCVRCSCRWLCPRVCYLSPQSGSGGRSVPGPVERCGSPGLQGGASRRGPGGGKARLGAYRAPHLPTPLPKDEFPGGAPSPKDKRFLLENLSQKLSPLSPVPQASRLALGRDR